MSRFKKSSPLSVRNYGIQNWTHLGVLHNFYFFCRRAASSDDALSYRGVNLHLREFLEVRHQCLYLFGSKGGYSP